MKINKTREPRQQKTWNRRDYTGAAQSPGSTKLPGLAHVKWAEKAPPSGQNVIVPPIFSSQRVGKVWPMISSLAAKPCATDDFFSLQALACPLHTSRRH
jgi:hypothetical protein